MVWFRLGINVMRVCRLFLFLLLCASCGFSVSSKVNPPVESPSTSRIDTIYYHSQARPYSKGWPIVVNVMDVSTRSSHTCINSDKVDAVARYHDVLIVITNDSCLFEHTYNKDSLALEYSNYQFCDYDEDGYLMFKSGDTLIFYDNENITVSLLEASISEGSFSIGELCVGMDENQLSKAIGIKKWMLKNTNKIIILPDFYYTMSNNDIRHPRAPLSPPFYDRIILTMNNQLKGKKVTMVSASSGDNFLLGPNFRNSGIFGGSIIMEE